MPNWTHCKVDIIGPPSRLAALVGALPRVDGRPIISLSSLVPMPPELGSIHVGRNGEFERWREIDGQTIPLLHEEEQELLARHGARDWYEWGYRNWGTKWDASGAAQLLADRVRVWWKVANGLPNQALASWTTTRPEMVVEVAWSEGGCEVWGTARIQRGVVSVLRSEKGIVHSDADELDDEDEKAWLERNARPEWLAFAREHELEYT